MFGLSPSTIIYGVIALAVISYVGHCEYVKKDRAQFIAKLEAQAEEQLRQNKLKEAADAKRIKDALSERDAALAKLRQRPNPVSLSASPVAPAGSSQVCFDSTAYNAAFGRYRERLGEQLDRINAISVLCGEAQIDGKALVDSWPR